MSGTTRLERWLAARQEPGLVRYSGQTVDVARPVRTGGRDAHRTPLVAPAVVASALPCVATQRSGREAREVTTATGDRAILDWEVLLLPGAPEIRPSDTLTLHPEGVALNVIGVNPAPQGFPASALLTATSGGKP